MEELVQRIVQSTGVSQETATKAVEEVIAYIEERAPGPVADQMKKYLTDERAASAVSAAEGALGGMLGKNID